MPEINPPDNLPTEENTPETIPPEGAPVQEFFKREEIKTMERDVAELREEEAEAEKERIASLKAEIKIQAPPIPTPPAPNYSVPPAPPAPISQPTRSSPFKKIVVRGIIILLVLFALSFSFWLWRGKKPATQQQPVKTEMPAPKSELSLLPSLISTQDTRIVNVSTNEEIPAQLEQSMKIEITANSLARIAIKNSPENRWASLDDLASAFKVSVPAEILNKLEPNFTLALFSQKEGVRIALVAQTTDALDLTDLLKTWEKNAPFNPKMSSFKTAHYQGKTFKYLTLGTNDFGIVYMVLDNYLILTSSYESMKNIADQLIINP